MGSHLRILRAFSKVGDGGLALRCIRALDDDLRRSLPLRSGSTSPVPTPSTLPKPTDLRRSCA